EVASKKPAPSARLTNWRRVDMASSRRQFLIVCDSALPPEPGQRAARAVHGIGVRQRHLRDADDGALVLGLAAAAEIVCSVLGIGADHGESRRRPQAMVPGAGGEHRDVAGGKLEYLAGGAAEAHLGTTARDAERLVDHGMIVHVREDAVAPH